MSGYLSKKGVYISATDVGTESSPTYTGMTLSGLTASTVVYSNASKAITSLANSAGYLLNDGSGGLSWGAISFAGYLKADGTVPLTADWNVGAFDLTCVDMNATNFKLSGTGTLTSTAGNASLTTSLVAATGDEAAFTLAYTTNKAAGNDTGLKIVQTDTVSGGTSYLIDAVTGSTSKFSISNAGNMVLNGTFIELSGNTAPYIKFFGSYLYLESANVWQFGVDFLASSPATIKAADATGDDNAGATLTIAGGRGTDTGVGGSVKIATAPAGAGGSNAGTLVNRVEVDSTGAVKHLGVNAQSTNIKQATVVLTVTNNPTTTATSLIPAGSLVIGVSCRNTSAIAGDATMTGYDVGWTSDANAWGDNVSPNINEITDLTDCTITTPLIFAAAGDVIVAYRGSGTNFTAGGTIRVTVHYISLTAPAT